MTDHTETPTLPRYLHKAQVADKLVESKADYDKALGEGWSKDAVAVTLYKDDETATVYSLEALQVARSQGWTTKKPAGADAHPPETEPAKAKK